MIVKPRIRGFICTTAHPLGCRANVEAQIRVVQSRGPVPGGPKKVLVVGASGGYGLASRIVAAFGCGADTLGISLEKAPTETKTGTAGWYNNAAFEDAARAAGRFAQTLDGDAFSDAMKARAVAAIQAHLGQVDLVIYSLASPVRLHPRTGELHRSAIKPLGDVVHIKTLNVDKGEVSEVDLEPADAAETAATVQVMGGEDWELWMDALAAADVLAPGCRTVAFTYLGSELTWPIYWGGTLGRAKEDLDRAAAAIRGKLGADSAHVAALKAVVTQASSAIPVVPLYVSLLFRVMKEAGSHEDCIEHIDRLFRDFLYAPTPPPLDDAQRIRVDDRELADPVQQTLERLWAEVTTENLGDLGDLEGYRADFLKIFGFGLEEVDYDADVDPILGRGA